MRIKRVRPQSVKASKAVVRRRNIKAEDMVDEEEIVDDMPAEDEVAEEEVADVDVAPEATDLLFEAEDVAELVAEVTGEEVAVTVDDEAVTFEVGEDVFTVEPEGDEEILEATKKPLKNKKSVKASKVMKRRPAKRR